MNLDTATAITFVAEGSPTRHMLKAYVQGKHLIMADVAAQEFQAIVAALAGPKEKSRAQRLLSRITIVPNQPSARAQRLKPTKALQANDIIILGTGDGLGIVTMTADRKAVSAARAQSVHFRVFPHTPFSLQSV